MLIISCGKRNEAVIDLNPASSAFVSCAATLANALVGVRPYVPDASERTLRTQLLMHGVYASGVGVSREIVSLPAPRILRIYDVDTGEPARRLDGTTATITLSLESAAVTSTELLQTGGQSFELSTRQFIGANGKPEVWTVIDIRRTNKKGIASRRLRLDYGIDASAVNEYLGTSSWLTARNYKIERCEHTGERLSAIVAAEQHRLHYDVQIERSPSSASFATAWTSFDRHCTMSVTFDFAVADHQQLFANWQIRSRSDASKSKPPPPRSHLSIAENEHRARWAALWEHYNVVIDANGGPIEIGMSYAIFQLLQHGTYSCSHAHGFISPARGLTSTYHSGSTFFDTELHKCIFWIWNDPSVARALIDYRYYNIAKAIEFAKLTGFSGARFPEASNDRGGENGPHYVISYPGAEMSREWSVDEVLHISADICYALYRYWMTTSDDGYINSRGHRIIIECARFSESAFKWSDSKQAHVVNRVMGPDEYHYHVNNSFYTNYLLREHLIYSSR
ncbi:hypothetical protein LJR230_004813 [Trinickia sp. LjRoot230]|uniref:hypothetical protein n=1 Tax=Trinickia sp. LjRoot230 TaxID=3342288 RepID=UPI003ECD4618